MSPCETTTMMTRKITIMALVAGIVLGVATTEGFTVYRRSHDSRIFQERLRCKAIADAYVKENGTDSKEDPFAKSWVTVTLDKVDYSPARNSCVAELDTTYWYAPTLLERLSVQDLLSGESLFFANSTDEDFHASQDIFLPRVWDYVMNNASEPLDLERERARLELVPKSATPSVGPWNDYQHPKPASMLAPKSAPSSVTRWDAKGNPIPDSKQPPSGLTPTLARHRTWRRGPQLVDPYAQPAKQPQSKPDKSAPPSEQ